MVQGCNTENVFWLQVQRQGCSQEVPVRSSANITFVLVEGKCMLAVAGWEKIEGTVVLPL